MNILKLILIIGARALSAEPLALLANKAESKSTDRIGSGVLLVNEQAPKEAPEWIEIPFGQHDHKKGVQDFSRDVAEGLLTAFANERKEQGRRFVGLPIYVGHPDVAEFANEYRDKASKGWIKEMEIGAEALRLKTEWNPAGRELIANEAFKFFSPTWSCQRVAGKAATYRPIALKSIGLTNEPNIGVMPLTNEEQAAASASEITLPPWLCQALGIDANATEEQAKAALEQLGAAAKQTQSNSALGLIGAAAKAAGIVILSNDDAGSQPFFDWLKGEMAKAPEAMDDGVRYALQTLIQAKEAMEQMKKALGESQAAVANERKARVDLIVANAIEKGRVLIADKDKVSGELIAAGEQFDTKAHELANRAPLIRTTGGLTADLGKRKESVSLGDQVQTLVNERMTTKGEQYEAAFAAVKKEHSELFANMKQPVIGKK